MKLLFPIAVMSNRWAAGLAWLTLTVPNTGWVSARCDGCVPSNSESATPAKVCCPNGDDADHCAQIDSPNRPSAAADNRCHCSSAASCHCDLPVGPDTCVPGVRWAARDALASGSASAAFDAARPPMIIAGERARGVTASLATHAAGRLHASLNVWLN